MEQMETGEKSRRGGTDDSQRKDSWEERQQMETGGEGRWKAGRETVSRIPGDEMTCHGSIVELRTKAAGSIGAGYLLTSIIILGTYTHRA